MRSLINLLRASDNMGTQMLRELVYRRRPSPFHSSIIPASYGSRDTGYQRAIPDAPYPYDQGGGQSQDGGQGAAVTGTNSNSSTNGQLGFARTDPVVAFNRAPVSGAPASASRSPVQSGGTLSGGSLPPHMAAAADELSKLGYDPPHIAAALSRFRVESPSGLRTSSIKNPNDIDPGQVNSIGMKGIAQWDHSRQRNLANFAQTDPGSVALGDSSNSLVQARIQARFWDHEMGGGGGQPVLKDKFLSAQSPKDMHSVLGNFERAGADEGKSQQRALAYHDNILNSLGQQNDPNKSQPISGATTGDLSRYATGNARLGQPSSVAGVHPEFASRIHNMYQDMPPDIQSNFNITSGVRSSERQSQVNPSVTNSHHQPGIGMAVDTTMDPNVRKWITDNGGRYGVGYPLASDPKELNHLEPLENGQRVSPSQMRQWAQSHQAPTTQTAANSNTTSPQDQPPQQTTRSNSAPYSDVVGGRSSAAVLAQLQKIPQEQLSGSHVVLSPGVSNDNHSGDYSNVQKQFDYLNGAGAKVSVVGMGTKYGKENPVVQKMAQNSGFNYVPAGANDGIHMSPAGYSGVLNQAISTHGTPTHIVGDSLGVGVNNAMSRLPPPKPTQVAAASPPPAPIPPPVPPPVTAPPVAPPVTPTSVVPPTPTDPDKKTISSSTIVAIRPGHIRLGENQRRTMISLFRPYK